MSASFLEFKEVYDVLSKDSLFELHVDLMDGQFVSEITFGPKVLKDLQNIPLNVHLMVKDPVKYLEACSIYKIQYMALHYENLPSLEILEKYKKNFSYLGLVVNSFIFPENISSEILKYFDYYLLMAVPAGSDGQKYESHVEEKISFFQKNYPDKLLQIDGGLDLEKILRLKDQGINYFITGSWFFKDWKSHRDLLKRELS